MPFYTDSYGFWEPGFNQHLYCRYLMQVAAEFGDDMADNKIEWHRCNIFRDSFPLVAANA
jgi:hypothetical protein